MGSWRDVAAAVRGGAEPVQRTVSATESELIAAGVPDDLARELAWLERAPPPPKLRVRAQWAPTVADAIGIARRGFVRQALDLGWTVTDLFGIGPQDDAEFAGLAVWLAGRRLILIESGCAIAKSDASYATFTRGGFGHGRDSSSEPVLLWQFGRS